MNKMLRRFDAFCVLAVLVVASPEYVNAQVPAEIPSAGSGAAAASQSDIAKTYLQLREQLQATQLAIATNRIEAEVSARAAMAEKLDAIKSALDAERERHHLEALRDSGERAAAERAQSEHLRADRRMLWIAIVMSGMAIVAFVMGPLLQLRTFNRLTQLMAANPASSTRAQSTPAPTVPDEIEPKSSIDSNQRIEELINRIENRVLELEHNVARPSPTGSAATTSTYISAASSPRAIASSYHGSRIKMLLGNGHSLLAAGKAKEAAACYNEVLKLDLNHPEALVKRGAALEKLKQDDEAIQCYDRAIRADSKMTLAYLYKGGACNRLERYEEASKCYELALRNEDESRAAAHLPFNSS
jgi:tetratricopeptide (TPR) repeat protein